jgi:hypothetical protein
LFLYLSEKVGHELFKYLDMGNIDFGSGVSAISLNGEYIDKYKLVIEKIGKLFICTKVIMVQELF